MRNVRTSLTRTAIVVWLLLTIALPLLLMTGAIGTYKALDEQRTIYLRHRIASIAARLETLPAGSSRGPLLESFVDEPEIVDVVVLERPEEPQGDALANLWEGRELFRIESTSWRGEPLYRAHVPFHSAEGLRVARIDVSERSADFLLEPARRQLWIVSAGSAAIVLLSVLAALSIRRASAAQQKQLEMEHLARIGEMSAVLAHEIRNPLGTIKGFAQLLGERLGSEDAGLLQPVLSEASRLEGLVKDLLLYGRPAQPAFRPITMESVTETLRAHANVMRSGGVDLAISSEQVTFVSDVNLLEQALLNLMRNSAEAVDGSPGGVVRVEGFLQKRTVVWRVTDNGPGFSEESLKRLYEPFYTTKASGTGLGLAITRKLVDALHGELSLKNSTAGGVEAEIRLPLTTQEDGKDA